MATSVLNHSTIHMFTSDFLVWVYAKGLTSFCFLDKDRLRVELTYDIENV